MRRGAHEGVVSAPKGGYDLERVRRSVAAPMTALIGGSAQIYARSLAPQDAAKRLEGRNVRRRRVAKRAVPTNPSVIIAQVEGSLQSAIALRGVLAAVSLFQLVGLPQSREDPGPQQRHEDHAAAAENRRADRAKQARHAARFEFA
jgi:hypothetical protein